MGVGESRKPDGDGRLKLQERQHRMAKDSRNKVQHQGTQGVTGRALRPPPSPHHTVRGFLGTCVKKYGKAVMLAAVAQHAVRRVGHVIIQSPKMAA